MKRFSRLFLLKHGSENNLRNEGILVPAPDFEINSVKKISKPETMCVLIHCTDTIASVCAAI